MRCIHYFLVIFLLVLIPFAFADTNVYSCGILNISNERYVLQNNLNSTLGDCLIVDSDSVIVDGNGYLVNNENTSSLETRGVTVLNRQNVVLSNLIVSNFSTGILIQGSNNTVLSSRISGNSIVDFNVSGNSFNNSIANPEYIGSYYFSNGSFYSIEKSTFGKITFLDYFTAFGSNFSNEFNLANSFASVTSNLVSGFNYLSRVHFYNTLTNFTNATILRNGNVCPLNICYNLTALNSGNVIFNVSGWSNYSLVDFGLFVPTNSTSNSSNNNSTNSSNSSPSSSSSSSSSSNSNTPTTQNSNTSVNSTNPSNQNISTPEVSNYLFANQNLVEPGKSHFTGLFSSEIGGSKLSAIGILALVLAIVIAFLFFIRKRIIKHKPVSI